MKKSELYRMAQNAVLNDHLPNYDKLDILRVLMEDEDLAKFEEEMQEKEKANEELF